MPARDWPEFRTYKRRLYKSGTNSSHTPEGPRLRIGLMRPSQPLKSPYHALTRMALGAHTLQLHARDAFKITTGCAPISFRISGNAFLRPSNTNRNRTEAEETHRCHKFPAPPGPHSQPSNGSCSPGSARVRLQRPRWLQKVRLEISPTCGDRIRAVFQNDGGLRSAWEKSADHQAALLFVDLDDVRTKQPKRVAVLRARK